MPGGVVIPEGDWQVDETPTPESGSTQHQLVPCEPTPAPPPAQPVPPASPVDGPTLPATGNNRARNIILIGAGFIGVGSICATRLRKVTA